MLNVYDILETIRMIQDECLDIRTTTMGISLLDCIDTDIDKCAPQLSERLKKCVAAYGLPTGTDIPMSELLPFCSKDKKRESNTLNYIVCNEIGKAEIVKTTVDGFAALMEVVLRRAVL